MPYYLARVAARATAREKSLNPESTNSAKAAVSILLQERFDIIISDLRLPEIDGKALTSLIRASAGPNQSVPIVILSAANKEEVSGLFEAGATLVLDKNNLSELGKKLLPLVAKS